MAVLRHEPALPRSDTQTHRLRDLVDLGTCKHTDPWNVQALARSCLVLVGRVLFVVLRWKNIHLRTTRRKPAPPFDNGHVLLTSYFYRLVSYFRLFSLRPLE